MWGTLDDLGALVSTANATWWLVVATFLAFGATVWAVNFTLGRERRTKAEDRRRLDRSALKAVTRAFAYVHEVHDTQSVAWSDDERTLWPISAKLNSHRRVLEHFLAFPVNDEELPYLLTDALQRIYEVRDAIVGLLPHEHGKEWMPTSLDILARAVERMAESEATAAEAAKRIG